MLLNLVAEAKERVNLVATDPAKVVQQSFLVVHCLAELAEPRPVLRCTIP